MPPFGTGVERICAVVAARTSREMARLVRLGFKETPTIELRLDWLRTDSERSRFLAWLRDRAPRGATFLATCRRRAGGGRYSGNIAGELRWLARAREAGCTWCDLEQETMQELRGGSLKGLGLPPNVLLSVHHFDRTPKLVRAPGRPAGARIRAVKFAAAARTIADSVRVLALARKSKDVVAVPMGEVGLPARILALRAGSALAYAPVDACTAPGQVGLKDLKHLFRAHLLSGRSRVFGVIGDPVGHSLSPLMHNAAFLARGLDAVYLPFQVRALDDFLGALPELGLRGFSVTLPHKQTILPHLSGCEPLAREIGAVNTVVVRASGKLYGSNTDYLGVLRALERKLPLRRARVLVFGAGGSARAAAFALAHAGASVAVCARRESAARELARAVGGEALPRRALATLSFDAILNATPVGMHPRSGISPLAPNELNCRIVMDLIYRPMRTRLLELAASRGIDTVSGVEMFLAQGFAQYEMWTGTRAPERVMRRAVVQALRAEKLRGPS